VRHGIVSQGFWIENNGYERFAARVRKMAESR
jgi:hypothetical protein